MITPWYWTLLEHVAECAIIRSAKNSSAFTSRLHCAYSAISFHITTILRLFDDLRSILPQFLLSRWRYSALRYLYTRRQGQREDNIKTSTFAWRHQYLSSPHPISQLWRVAKAQPELHRKARRLNSPARIHNAAGNRNEDMALTRPV